MEIKKRFDRILAIYMQLQAKPLVRAQELSDRFGVSIRTIYRDIQSLQAAGIPLYGEAGVGYGLVEGYRIPAVSFTKEESLSFAAAEKLIANYFDKDLYLHFSSALFKMRAGLRSSEKDQVASVEDQVFLSPKPYTFNQKVPGALSLLLQSIAQKQAVAMEYLKPASDHAEDRLIEPIGLFYENNFWYIMAFCLLRSDYRQFRLDRIQTIKLVPNQRFSKQHEELSYYLELKKQPVETQEVVIQVTKKMARYMDWDRGYYGFLFEREIADNKLEMTFNYRDGATGFDRWILMFGDGVRIIKPEALRERVRTLLKEQLRLMELDDVEIQSPKD